MSGQEERKSGNEEWEAPMIRFSRGEVWPPRLEGP